MQLLNKKKIQNMREKNDWYSMNFFSQEIFKKFHKAQNILNNMPIWMYEREGVKDIWRWHVQS